MTQRGRELRGASRALLEMLERDGELDRILDGRGLTFDNPPAPKVPPPQPFYIPPPDWDQEAHEERQRERERQEQERERILEEELARLAAEDEHTYPKPPAKKRKWRT